MRIGILTFHCAHNYGAVLQCYALQEYLKKVGHDVYIIDYRLPYLLRCYKWFDIRRFLARNPITILKKIKCESTIFYARKARFDKFNGFINERLNLVSKESLANSFYDLVIVGSDQVWNINLTNGFDPYYWGVFEKKTKKTKVISYAASMELEEQSDMEKKEIIRLLDNFDDISVRELPLSCLIESLTSRKATVVCDPTLLLNLYDWDKLAIKPLIAEEYIFLYQVRANKVIYEYAKEVSKILNIKVITLSARVNDYNDSACVTASPEDFLGWIKYAKFVICTSFHGTVFSSIYNVPFVSLALHDGRDSRVKSYLSQIGLESQLVDLSCSDVNPVKNSFDWNLVNKKIKEYILVSCDYLRKNL